ncbi:membrane protein [Bacteroidia bacterium]|nr:membrane protein [Bacteroidia bacterium]
MNHPINKELLRKLTPYLVALAVFILIGLVYTYPALQGKVLNAGDIESGKGMGREAGVYHEETGEHTLWTGSMFCGMPRYQMGGHIPSDTYLGPLSRLLSFGMSGYFVLIFLYLFGFFVLLRSFKVNVWLCIAGSIAITFSSYFFIIIEAGHLWKVMALEYMAFVIGGMRLIFDKRYWGLIPTLIGSALGITVHPQMAYYLFMFIGILVFAELYIHIKARTIKDFVISLVLFSLAVTVGLGTRYTTVQVNQEFVKETMRGGHSELVKSDDSQNKTDGLDLDYATQWSYGIDETMTLLIPNYMGGSSNYDVGKNSKVYDALIKNGVPVKSAEEFCKSAPTYWGTQPFTSGPVYAGAIVMFLFVLGLYLVKGPYKWAILIATLFSVFLSWGKNFMPLTELFFNYFPMYNKFRAVSSILVVAEITIPLLGFLGIKAIFDKSSFSIPISKKEILDKIKLSTYIIGGICLFFALFGATFFSFQSPGDAAAFSQLPNWLGAAIVDERASMLRTDAFRSLIFIVLGAGILWYFVQEKMKFAYFSTALTLLLLFDMWGVDKRFFNNDSFVTPKQLSSNFDMQPYEKSILQDKDPHFRVLNLTTNTFNESRTSYYLKSIGGYNAAKLRRYQDLIDRYIAPMNWKVINMLNPKYIIVPGNTPENKNKPTPLPNPDAMGNAWFIDSLLIVQTPNEEIDALDIIDLKHTAVIDAKFADFAQPLVPNPDARVKLTSYTPKSVEYESSASQAGTIVFSEIYYPYGWKVTIDEQSVEHFRANYTLRALNVPAGEHKIKFLFDPDTVNKSEKVSLSCIFLLYGTIFGFVVYGIIRYARKRKKVS